MSVPVIVPTSSVFGALQWQPVEFIPYATNTPTSWSSTTLPTGLSINTTTGVISGTPTVACPCCEFALVATNGDGNSEPVNFTCAVDPADRSEATPSTAIEVSIDLGTGLVSSAAGAGPILVAKRGDDVMFLIAFKKAGTVVELDLTSLKFGLKKNETDADLVVSDAWHKSGTGTATRYQVHVVMTGAALDDELSNNEDEKGTQFDGLGEFEFIENNPWLSDLGPSTLRHSTQTFAVQAVRDLIPDA